MSLVQREDLIAKAISLADAAKPGSFVEAAEARAKIAMVYLKAAELIGNGQIEIPGFKRVS